MDKLKALAIVVNESQEKRREKYQKANEAKWAYPQSLEFYEAQAECQKALETLLEYILSD